MTGGASLLLGAGAGMAIAILYFASLHVSVQSLPRAAHPAAMMLAGLAARFVLALAGFYAVISLLGIMALLAAVTAFTLVRYVAVVRVQRSAETKT